MRYTDPDDELAQLIRTYGSGSRAQPGPLATDPPMPLSAEAAEQQASTAPAPTTWAPAAGMPAQPTVYMVPQPPGPTVIRVPRGARSTILLWLAVGATLLLGYTLMASNFPRLHLPHWGISSITRAQTSTVFPGPLVLREINEIDRPALGSADFNFTFTRKVSHSVGIWPCWYSAEFQAVGHASATVDLNPGPAWWKPATGHYQLKVLRAPRPGIPGAVAITIVLPAPQLPQTVHDVSVDNTLSHPVDVQHSWTYPGLGCGALVRPQFSVSVLYAQAQQIAFTQATHAPGISSSIIAAAEREAGRMISGNFIAPTLSSLGYQLTQFTLKWAPA